MVKLSWKDLATAALVVAGGVLFYAKIYDFSWPVIESWRSSILLMGAAALGIFALDAGDMTDNSATSLVETLAALAVTTTIVISLFVATETAFIVSSVAVALFWLFGLARHSWHSYDTSNRYHGMPTG